MLEGKRMKWAFFLIAFVAFLLYASLEYVYESPGSRSVSDTSMPFAQGERWRLFKLPWVNPAVQQQSVKLALQAAHRGAILRVTTSDKSPDAGGKSRALSVFVGDFHHATILDVMSMVMSRGGTLVYGAQMDLWHKKWLKNNQALTGKLVYAKSTKPFPDVLRRMSLIKNKFPAHLESTQRTVFEYYKDDPIMRSVDAFICTFPLDICQLFFAFNKTVIFAPAHCYSLRACSRSVWDNLTSVLQRAAASSKPRHFVVAFSQYDIEYVNYFTGLRPMPMFSSSRIYVPPNHYKPTRVEILVGPLNLESLARAGGRLKKQLKNRTEFVFATVRELYGIFELSQLIQHRAAVLFPYAVMSYGITELYAMGVPMFVPSMQLIRKEPILFPDDRTATGTHLYCGFNQTIVPPKHPSSPHRYSPESVKSPDRDYWTEFADYMHWPHITQFDNVSDLVEKLRSTDLHAVHRSMMAENQRRERQLDTVWQTIANGIDAEPRIVPKEFHTMDHFLPNL